MAGLIGSASCKVQRCFVENVDIQQQSQQAEAQYSASFLSGYSAYGQSELCGNVIYSGQISTSNPEASFNIGGAGTREDNYVSGTLAINGTFRQSGDAAADGVTATAEQLGTQSFTSAWASTSRRKGPGNGTGTSPRSRTAMWIFPKRPL